VRYFDVCNYGQPASEKTVEEPLKYSATVRGVLYSWTLGLMIWDFIFYFYCNVGNADFLYEDVDYL
jgi:hypothetical protein